MDDDIETMIDDCMNLDQKMNDWERTFIDSISTQYFDKGSLSQNQADKLESIWEKLTS